MRETVEAIRCKNCVFYQKEPELAKANGMEPEWYCALHRAEFGPDAFCSYGREKPFIGGQDGN